MFEKIDQMATRLDEIQALLIDPEVMSNTERFQGLLIEHGELEPIVTLYRAYKKDVATMQEDRELLEVEEDPEMRALLESEVREREAKIAEDEAKLKKMLIPKDPNDDKNVIVEIRAGVGGDEAGLFAGDLTRLYTRYAERHGWKVDMMNTNDQGIGGVKEAIFMIEGRGAYSRLKYESGVHRVQRVPETESSGRIHTSTATVAVMPEAEDVDIEIRPEDIRVDVYRSSGHGGQSVNTTDSAVRITYLPLDLIVTCQDEKSQLKNKEKALKILKSRLYDLELARIQSEQSAEKRGQIGTGDRSERIRTYNFPQGRVTDHRINMTLYRLEDFLDGDIDEMVDALILEGESAKLAD